MKAVVSVAVIRQVSAFARARMRELEFFKLTISGKNILIKYKIIAGNAYLSSARIDISLTRSFADSATVRPSVSKIKLGFIGG